MKNIYKNIYNENKNLGLLQENPRIKIMLKITDNLNFQNKRIFDIGCYNGIFLSSIKNRNNSFFGIDASSYAIRESLKKGINAKQFFFDSKTKIPFPKQFFDLVIAGEIIEHIFDTDFFLEEIYRILKIEGKLIISTPNIASFGRRLMLLFGINPLVELSPNETNSCGHIRYFTFASLNSLLKKHRFKILKAQSDVINFSANGRLKSHLLPRLFPDIGQSIIYLCRKNNHD